MLPSHDLKLALYWLEKELEWAHANPHSPFTKSDFLFYETYVANMKTAILILKKNNL